MPARPFRLLHAAQTLLDAPLETPGPIPEELYELFATATLQAWQRLIDLAIKRSVDCLLLTGNTFIADQCSLPAELALRAGLERLATAGIPVFVMPGRLDPISEWDKIPDLPDNLTVFRSSADEAVELNVQGGPGALIVPASEQSARRPPELVRLHGEKTENRFLIGMLAQAEARTSIGRPEFRSFDYLACGDLPEDQLPLTDAVVRQATSLQGLSAADAGLRGAWLVQLDRHKPIDVDLIPLAPIRWERIRVGIDGIFDREALLEKMLGELEELSPWPGERARCLWWSFDGGESGRLDLDEEAVAQQIAMQLRDLTDKSTGVRHLHWVESQGPDSNAAPTGTHELWRDYDAALQGEFPVQRDTLNRVIADAHLGPLQTGERWNRWLEQMTPERLELEARRLGWRWLTSPRGSRPR